MAAEKAEDEAAAPEDEAPAAEGLSDEELAAIADQVGMPPSDASGDAPVPETYVDEDGNVRVVGGAE